MKRVLTIVPPSLPEDHEGPCLTTGTSVIDEHGNKLPGICEISLNATTDSFWQATIKTHCALLPPEGVTAECTIEPSLTLEERIEAIKTRYNHFCFVDINLEGSVQIDGTLRLDELEELCRSIRSLTK